MRRGPVAHHLGRVVAHQQEQRDADAPEGDELRVRRRHAVALAVDARRALLLDQALEQEVERLAEELAGEGEEDLGLARGEDQGGVDDAEGLREEGEVRAEEGQGVVGVLRREEVLCQLRFVLLGMYRGEVLGGLT